MSRLVTAAPLHGLSPITSTLTGLDGEGASFAGTAPTVVTDRVRTTGYEVYKATAVPGYAIFNASGGPGFTLGRSYWARVWYQVDTLPGTTSEILGFVNGTTGSGLRVKANGSIAFYDDSASATELMASAAGSIAVDTWFKVEVRVKLAAVPTSSNGEAELWVNDVLIGSQTGIDLGTTNWNALRIGWLNTSGLTAVWFTDVAVNDDQGTDQNGRPDADGVGTVHHILAGTDSVDGLFTAGGGGTDLKAAVGGKPPGGVAQASATSTSQILSTNTAATDSCEIISLPYNDVIPVGHEIRLMNMIARIGTSSTTGTNPGTMRLLSNPADSGDATIDFEGSTAVAGTDPAGWRSYRSAYVYRPSVARGTGATMRLVKNHTGGRYNMCSYMAVVVETIPRPPTNLPRTPTADPHTMAA